MAKLSKLYGLALTLAEAREKLLGLSSSSLNFKEFHIPH